MASGPGTSPVRALIVNGRAESPGLSSIEDDRVEFLDAAELKLPPRASCRARALSEPFTGDLRPAHAPMRTPRASNEESSKTLGPLPIRVERVSR